MHNVFSGKEPRHRNVYLSQLRVTGFDRVAHILELVGQGLEIKDEMNGS